MVKGVNKRVIEVNNTGNKFFEKIVFYVKAEYGDLTSVQLKEATEFLSLGFEEKFPFKNVSLRKRRKLRKIRVICAVSLFCLGVTAAVLWFIL